MQPFQLFSLDSQTARRKLATLFELPDAGKSPWERGRPTRRLPTCLHRLGRAAPKPISNAS
jgi:hypothetical protein